MMQRKYNFIGPQKVVFFLLMLALTGYLRYRSGSHYSATCVALDCRSGDISISTVAVKSPWNSSALLERDPVEGALWRRPDFEISPTALVIVKGYGRSLQFHSDRVFVRLGQSLGVFQKNIPLQPIRELRDGDEWEIEYGPQQKSTSVLSTPSRTLNWQGDISFAVVILTQSLLLAFTFFACLHIFRRLTENPFSVDVDSIAPSRVLSFFNAIIFCIFAILLTHRVWINLTEALKISDAVPVLAGMAIVAILFAMFCMCKECKFGIEQGRIGLGIAYIFLYTLVKILWIIAGDHNQSGDYATYASFGESMALGEWDFDASFEFTSLYAIRAYLFTYPLAILDSFLPNGIGIGNCMIQACTLLLWYCLCLRTIGKQGAIVALVCFSLYPEFLFNTPLASHDIPAIFWLVLLFLLVQLGVETSGKAFSPSSIICLVGIAIASGCVGAMLEMQRSYFAFILVGVFLCAILLCFQIGRFKPKRVGICVVAVAIGLCATFVTTNIVKNHILWRASLPSGSGMSTVGYLSSSNVETGDEWNAMMPWRFLYWKSVPKDMQQSLAFRKIAFEKLDSGFWAHLLKKNSAISDTSNAARKLGSRFDGEQFPSVYFVPWLGTKLFLCNWIEMVFVLAALLRLLLIDQYPVKQVEIFPLCFAGGSLLFLLVFTEAAPQYDVFLAISLSLNCGILVTAAPRKCFRATRRLHLKRALVGSAALLLVVGLQHVSYRVSEHFGWTFYRLAPVHETISQDARSINGINTNKRRIYVSTAEIPDSPTWYDFDVLHPARCTQLRFFLSLNQEHRGVWQANELVRKDILYQLFVNDKQVAIGNISDLSTPRFITVDVDATIDVPSRIRLGLSKTMDGSEDKELPNYEVAIEYVF